METETVPVLEGPASTALVQALTEHNAAHAAANPVEAERAPTPAPEPAAESGDPAPDEELTPRERMRLRRLARAQEIMESQLVNGTMRPLAKWPRKLRREFSRLADKEGFR